MQPFTWERPQSMDEALRLAGSDDAMVVACGTEAINLMREGLCAPMRLVCIDALTELERIEFSRGKLVIGALATMSEVAGDARVARDFPAISSALLQSASPQLRSMASVGGNLLQRTRCPYFRNGALDVPCNKRTPGSGCAALAAEDALRKLRHPPTPAQQNAPASGRDFAVFDTTKHCIATHPSDLAVVLAALDASVVLMGLQGETMMPVARLHRLPGDTPQIDTELGRGELLVHFSVPASPLARSSVYVKVTDRAAYQGVIVSTAAAVEVRRGTVSRAKVAVGGVAHRPWRSELLEQALVGQDPRSTAVRRVAQAALERMQPRDGSHTKLLLAARAIEEAVRRSASMDR